MSHLFTFLLTTIICSGVNPANLTTTPVKSEYVITVTQDKRDLIYAIDEALKYIKKALESESVSDLRYNARKASNEAVRAKNEAGDIDLDAVESECADAFRYCRNAEDARETKDAIEYLKKARSALQSAYSRL